MPKPQHHTGESESLFREDDLLRLQGEREVVVCPFATPIHVAARLMTEKNVGSIVIVDETHCPRGIVTDTDLRKKVVAGELSLAEPIESIMSSPVTTVPAGVTAADAILHMMKRNIRHLCVTEDGTPASRITGMISEHDLLLLHGNNPAVLMKEISQATDVDRLSRIRDRVEELVRKYLMQEVSIRFVANVVTEMNDAIIGKIIAFAEDKILREGTTHPKLGFCWLAFGSEGRREQLLRTDQDNAIIYQDPPQGQEKEAQEFFNRLGVAVTGQLARCGFQLCPGNNMASNPSWCQPISKWKEYFRQWIHVPRKEALLNAAIFFDFRSVYGDDTLAVQLREHITGELKRSRTALILLANDAVHNPDPLSVLGRFLVDRKGSHKGRFDIKLRALKPLTDAARVLALDRNVHSFTNTVERFHTMGEMESSMKELCEEAVMAFQVFSRYRVLQGLQHQDSGRYLDLTSLTPMEREVLRGAFRPVKELQSLLKVRFQLDSLGLR